MPIQANEIEVEKDWVSTKKNEPHSEECSICKEELDYDGYRTCTNFKPHSVQECLSNLATKVKYLEEQIDLMRNA